MTFPGAFPIPEEAITSLPWYVFGGIVTIIVIVWLFQAIVGLVKALHNWRKDENVTRAAVRAERNRELAEAIASARESRLGEARWHGQYLAINEEMTQLKARMAALGAEKDALVIENSQNAYRLRLHRAFMGSPVVSEASKAAWEAFLEAEKRAHDPCEPSPGHPRLPNGD
jgi:hypothetical protein